MSLATHDDECSDCRPALVDVKTGAVAPDDSSSMQIVLRVWSTLTLAEKQGWHRFCCQNSRALPDIQISKSFSDRV
jgi:hypothetical protein